MNILGKPTIHDALDSHNIGYIVASPLIFGIDNSLRDYYLARMDLGIDLRDNLGDIISDELQVVQQRINR